jgi:cleavage and polyadenylation specificity factor subunit 4
VCSSLELLNFDLRVCLLTDSQLCRAYLDGHCPLGSKCPLRHVKPSVLNFRAPSPPLSSAHARTVCKHWLRGLCKKGSACEFLHEYNLRKMPECWFFAKYAYCSSGDECMYLHIGPEERRGECKGYARGFCPLGEYFLRDGAGERKKVTKTCTLFDRAKLSS